MPSDQTISVSELLQSYADSRAGEAPTLQTIFKNIVLPALGIRILDSQGLQAELASLPAHRLYALLGEGRMSWSETLRQSLPHTETYQKAYLRAIRRFIEHGERLGLLHPDEYDFDPAWRELMQLLQPHTCNLTVHKRSMLRCGFRSLARWATTSGLSPADVPGERQEGGRFLEAYYRTFDPRRDHHYYQARQAWNMLVQAHPERGLVEWGHEQPYRCRGLPKSEWPAQLSQDLRILVERHALETWTAATVEGYESRIANYLGALNDQALSVRVLFADMPCALDSLRLLFQGIPADWPRQEASVDASRLVRDRTYREELLAAMRELSGSHDGRESEPNPFITLALTAWVAEGKHSSAYDLLTKALSINRGILGMTDRHVRWCVRRRQAVGHAIRRFPSTYALKKKLVFRTPTVWRTLVLARERLRSHTMAVESEWRKSIGQRRLHLGVSWAVALRNEVLFGLMLCYPLRVSNLSGMRLGDHYDIKHHRIFIPAEETKNRKDIEYELPEGGSLGDLRGLVEAYLEEARPILLGKQASKYFFVPGRLGGIRIRKQGFNLILSELSRNFLSDLLPDGLRELNPHLLRHVVATHHLAVERDLNLAAQMLNDAPSSVSKSYADVLGSTKETTKAYLSHFTL